MTALTARTKTLVAALLLVMTTIAAMGTIKLAAEPSLRSAHGDDRSNGNFASNAQEDEPAKKEVREGDSLRRIEGRVVDHQGNKIAGADVWLPIRFRDPRHVAHGRTNQQGRFVLEAPKSWLPPTPNQGLSIAWAYKKGYPIATASAYQALYSGMSNHPMELKLGPATDTSFVVLDPGGKPLAGASVEPHHFRSSVGYSIVPEEMLPMLRARTDMRGRARLPGIPRKGLLHVNVVSKQFGTQQQRLLDTADSPAERTIRLRPVAKVVGQLFSKDPIWARGVQFYLTTNLRGADPGHAGPTTGVAMVTSDANGRFEVGALAEGILRIEGGIAQTAPVRAVLPRDQVISAANDSKLEIRLVSGVKVRGLVRTKDTQQPIANVVVSIRYGVYRQGDHVVSDNKGRFTARVLPGEVYQHVIAIPPGRELTQVGAPWNERFRVPSDVEEFELPVIELARTIKVEGRLLDQHGRPVVEVNVHGVKGNRRYGFSKTDRQGRFVLRLPKGLKTEYYSIWVDNRPYRAKILKGEPLLLRVDLPKRKGADDSDRQSD